MLAPVNSVDRRYRDVYSQVWNFTLERQLWRNASVRAFYLGNKGLRIPRQMFSNGCTIGLVACESRSAGQFPRADVNFPVTVGGMQTVGKSIYHGFQTEIEHRYSSGIFLNANYTFGRVIGLSTSPADPLGNASLERGPDVTSIAHVFHFNGVWDLPFGPGSGVLAAIARGWQLAGLLHIQSGQPFTVTAPAPDTGTGSSVNPADRIADGRLSTDRPNNDWLN